MTERTVLLLGSRRDPHISRIEEEIEAIQIDSSVVLDFQASTFELTMDDDGQFSLMVDGVKVSQQAIVFDRPTIQPGTAFYPSDCDGNADFVAAEWRAVFRLIGALYGDQVINTLISRTRTSKVAQQMVAASVGLKVPNSLISNDRNAVIEFSASANASLIVKPLAGAAATIERANGRASVVVMTNRVLPEDISSATQEEFGSCPHFFQHEIEKTTELRVVWIDGKHFAFRINSQDYSCTQTDWRWAGGGLTYTPCDIDADLKTRIDKFMQEMGFYSGSLDLVIDVHGIIWFLECNEQGAWVWLDELVDGAISKEFASALLRRTTRTIAQAVPLRVTN